MRYVAEKLVLDHKEEAFMVGLFDSVLSVLKEIDIDELKNYFKKQVFQTT